MKSFYKKRTKKNTIIAMIFFFVIVMIFFLLIGRNNYNNQINRISVSSLPAKTEYFINEEFKTDGLIIEVTKNDGDFYLITGDKCDITGFDSSKPIENQVITVTYKKFKCTFMITIKELPQSVPVLVEIYLDELPKTEYKVGESLDTSGGIIVREYQDGSTRFLNLINYYVYGFTSEKVGEYTLTVIYVENGIQVQTTYEIIVTE